MERKYREEDEDPDHPNYPNNLRRFSMASHTNQNTYLRQSQYPNQFLDQTPSLISTQSPTQNTYFDLESAFSRFNLSSITPTNNPINTTHNPHSIFTTPTNNLSYPSTYLPYYQSSTPVSRPTIESQLVDERYERLVLQLKQKDALISHILAQAYPNTSPSLPLSLQSLNGFELDGSRPSIGNNGIKRSHLYDENRSRRSSYGRSEDLSLTSQYNLLQLERMKLEDFRGSMANMAKDQNGCRYLQKKIEEAREDDLKMIFMDVRSSISELMVDQFGNYLIQKLLDVCTEEQKTEILFAVSKSDYVLVTICKDAHGTRAMQKLLEHLTTQQQTFQIIKALMPVTVPLTTDLNGHHVIQHCIKHFSNEDTKYLLDAVATNCVKIARDRSGCCVLQLCVEHTHGEIRERLIGEIIRNALLLADDPYGNYVVQHILGMKLPDATAKLLRKFEGEFLHLSTQKFSSNVVERFLKESTKEQAMQVIKELVEAKDILPLLQDMFGNYVIQTALVVSYKTPLFNSIVERIGMHYSSLRSHPFGKRIIQKIDTLMNKQQYV